MKEDQLASLLESYLQAKLATEVAWAIYCIWHKRYYGVGAGAADHRGPARKNPLYIIYKDAKSTQCIISRCITAKLGSTAWVRVLRPMPTCWLIMEACP